jgi:hypothetical protein
LTIQLLYISDFMGLGIEVYFILILLGIPTFFFWRWLFKKYIQADKIRKIAVWAATIISTPLLYVGIGILYIFSVSYYPTHDFDKQRWHTDEDNRYELSDDLIKSKMLIGKTKNEVRQLLGNETKNQDSVNTWYYGLGYRPGLFNIDPSYLEIEFQNNKVSDVEQYK